MTRSIAMFSVVVENYSGLSDEVTDFAEQGVFLFKEMGWLKPILYNIFGNLF